MADFRKGEPVRVTYDALYYAEPDHRPDEYALVVLPGTPLDDNVLILNRFRAPITALTRVDDLPIIVFPFDVLEAAARQIHTSYDRSSPVEQHEAREAARDALNAAAARLAARE